MSYKELIRNRSAAAIAASAAVATGMAVTGSAAIGLRWPLALSGRLTVVGDAGGSWGAPWEQAALPPSSYQAAALSGLTDTLIRLLAFGELLALLCLVLHAVSYTLSAWRGLAIRHALGASLAQLFRELGLSLLRLGALGCGVGFAGGAALLVPLRLSWPALFSRPPLVLGAGIAVALSWAVVSLVMILLSLAALTLLRRGVRTVSQLHGDHVTRGGGVLLLQSALAVVQLAGLLVVTYGSVLILTDAAAAAEFTTLIPDSSVVAASVEVTGGGPARAAAWRAVLPLLGSGRERRAALTSQDAWLGGGKELSVIALCPDCNYMGLALPMVPGRARMVAVAPDAIEQLGGALRRGRGILPRDTLGAPRVAVLSQAAAEQLYPGGNPLHDALLAGVRADQRYEIIGISSFEAPRVFGNGARTPVVFISALQHPPERAEIVTRRSLWDSLRARIAALPADASAPAPRVAAVRPLADRQGDFAAPFGWFGALFGGLALSASGIGAWSLGAVLHEMVRQRHRDIAIRMALGARTRDVERWVTRRTLWITMTGAYLGISGARWIGVVLHGARASGEGDVALIGAMVLAFGALGLVASWLPARRAARVAPAEALARVE